MTKVAKRIMDIIFIILIVILIGYFALRNSGTIEIYEVETGSMEDGIHPGDYVLIYKKKNYKVGDIVTYKKDNYYITHRIIKEDSKGVITKGDANNTEDEKIKKDSIVGKVIIIGGMLNFVIDYKFGIVSFLLGIYLITLYIKKERKRKAEKKAISTPKESIKKKVKLSKKETKKEIKKIKKQVRPKYRKK